MSEKHTCCGQIYSGWGSRTCGKAAKFERVEGWYCGTHDPIAVQAKRDARNAEYAKEQRARWDAMNVAEAKRKETQRRADCFDDFVLACRSVVNAFDALPQSDPARYSGLLINELRAALLKAQGEAL